MSKRLQVVLDGAELREIREAARRSRMTVSEWVRQALRTARRGVPKQVPRRKLEVVRASSMHAFPTADIDQMLLEIEGGYENAGPR